MRFVYGLWLLAALGSGCAATVVPGDASDAAPPTDAPSQPDVSANGDYPITLEQIGGFAFRHTRYVLAADGTVQTFDLGRGGPATITHAPNGATDAYVLAVNISRTGVYGLAPADYRPMDRCCDRIEDTLTLMFEGRALTYQAMADGANAPQVLLDTLRLVNRYVQNAR